MRTESTATNTAVHQSEAFRITTPQHVLDDLNGRLARTRWSEIIGDSDDDWAYGLSLPYLRELVQYWQHDFDWRAQEAAINRFAQFTAEVDGHRVHFIHERGRGPAPLPIVLTHGFPDSFL